MYSVYKHTSPSGKVYIGITSRKPEWRWNHGKGYCHGDQGLFANAINKYGWDSINHEIILSGLSEEKAKKYEIELIRFYKMIGLSYNITDGGDGHRGTYDRSHILVSGETRKRMSIAHKGQLSGDANPMYGRHETAPAYGKFGKKHPASKRVFQYDIDGKLIKKWDCLSDVQRELGILVTNITAVCKGKKFTCGGYRWSYLYPYAFSEEEKSRREAKRKKLSEIAKEGYKTGRRKPMIGPDNPMSKEYKLKKIEAQKQIAKSRGTSSSSNKK